MTYRENLLSLQEASQFATNLLKRDVTNSNISYLVQYGRIKRYGENGSIQVSQKELENYYQTHFDQKEERWKNHLGEDLNWSLSFDGLPERERTKHVHRLHPYKGKFIPQLVEYFLDSHLDSFKTEVFFKTGDIIYDPFCGSGTTLVQANELGINALGTDVSAFNALISNVKVDKHDLSLLGKEVSRLTSLLEDYLKDQTYIEFDRILIQRLQQFNYIHFPSPQYRYDLRQGLINEKEYGVEREQEFNNIFNSLIDEYSVILKQTTSEHGFLDTWFCKPIREEIDFLFNQIHEIENIDVKKVLAIILSRTMRSCRATTHEDLATLVEPVFSPYYCKKHGKICKPVYSISSWWVRYSKDTIKRLYEFNTLRTNTYQHCFSADSQTIDLFAEVKKRNPSFYNKLQKQKIKGVFSSPPYVGLIDYHEQHAYAYDLFHFERKDEVEIGAMFKGQNQDAKDDYVKGVSNVLINSRRFLQNDFDIFLVANDKYSLYPVIADKAGMKIVNSYKRPVLNRTEKNKTPYSETIFHIKGK